MSDEAKKVDDGGPAFPNNGWQNGMSLRDAFAKEALRALIGEYNDPCYENWGDTAANWAYTYADAMIERRKR